jgi:hypothetical protein
MPPKQNLPSPEMEPPRGPVEGPSMATHLHEDGETLGDYNGTWTLLPRKGE